MSDQERDAIVEQLLADDEFKEAVAQKVADGVDGGISFGQWAGMALFVLAFGAALAFVIRAI